MSEEKRDQAPPLAIHMTDDPKGQSASLVVQDDPPQAEPEKSDAADAAKPA